MLTFKLTKEERGTGIIRGPCLFSFLEIRPDSGPDKTAG